MRDITVLISTHASKITSENYAAMSQAEGNVIFDMEHR